MKGHKGVSFYIIHCGESSLLVLHYRVAKTSKGGMSKEAPHLFCVY